MTEPVSEGRINDERIDEEYAANNSIKIECEAKSKLVLGNSRDCEF
jgi:hypothetical protein